MTWLASINCFTRRALYMYTYIYIVYYRYFLIKFSKMFCVHVARVSFDQIELLSKLYPNWPYDCLVV